MNKSLDELIEILKTYYSKENLNTTEKKPRVSIKHLTPEEQQIYRKEWARLTSQKYFYKSKDNEGVNRVKRNYYEKTKEHKLMMASYKYYLKSDRLELFKKRKPEYYSKLLELGILN